MCVRVWWHPPSCVTALGCGVAPAPASNVIHLSYVCHTPPGVPHLPPPLGGWGGAAGKGEGAGRGGLGGGGGGGSKGLSGGWCGMGWMKWVGGWNAKKGGGGGVGGG